jgi:hypothetical protein
MLALQVRGTFAYFPTSAHISYIGSSRSDWLQLLCVLSKPDPFSCYHWISWLASPFHGREYCQLYLLSLHRKGSVKALVYTNHHYASGPCLPLAYFLRSPKLR